MTFDGFSIEINSGAGAELRATEDEASGFRSESVTLEEKVTRLFETLREPVYRYLVAAFGDAAEAEDITQDAFLQLYRTLRDGGSIENARFWIFRVAHNLSVNRRKHAQFLSPLDAGAWEAICRSLADASLNPEQRVLQQERYERLHKALGRLSQQERQCLHLRAEGFRYREIAEILNIKTPTVGEFLRRGIKKLTTLNDV